MKKFMKTLMKRTEFNNSIGFVYDIEQTDIQYC